MLATSMMAIQERLQDLQIILLLSEDEEMMDLDKKRSSQVSVRAPTKVSVYEELSRLLVRQAVPRAFWGDSHPICCWCGRCGLDILGGPMSMAIWVLLKRRSF